MNILYFGMACSKELERKILEKTKTPYTVAQNNLERALLDGFIQNGVNSITANCVPSLNYQVLGEKLIFSEKDDKINEIINTKTYTVINLPLIKYLFYFISTIFRILKWYKASKDSKKVIFVAVNFIPVTLPILLMSYILKYETACLLCDISKDMYSTERIKKFPFFKRLIMPLYYNVIKAVESNYDFYVFLTEEMNVVNVKNKPYVVVEGIFNNDLNLEKIKEDGIRESDKVILLYSGSLFRLYGIEKILEVFNKINDDRYELYFYGDGECKVDILEAQKTNPNIHFCGFVSREELFGKLQEATVLLNLRNPEDSYTKYSFPSKLFEYMVSGTPVITTKLKGIPMEYDNYLYTIDSYDTDFIKNKIMEICKKDKNELNNFGMNARNFILNNKGAINQSKKIIDGLK